LIVAATGKAPGESYDIETLVGQNVTLITESKTSKKGNTYAKITAVAPAGAGQTKFTAPPPATKPVTASVGF
jgi:hypothetical protein